MDNDIYSPRSRNEIVYFVNARQKTYLTSTEIYIPNNPYEKIEDGYEPVKRTYSHSGDSIETSKEDKDDRSRRRAKTAVKDLALSNKFDLFVTFTFGTNRFDADKSRLKLNGWLKRRRKQDKEFQYIVVPEEHRKCEECVENKTRKCIHDDRIKALHFHLLVNGYGGKIVRSIDSDTGKPKVKHRRKVYDFPNYTLGLSEVYKIGDTDEDRIKSAFYILKYIKKEMPTFKNKKRYWASRGLNKPLAVENPDEWYMDMTPDHVIETPFGKLLYFNNDRIDEVFLP